MSELVAAAKANDSERGALALSVGASDDDVIDASVESIKHDHVAFLSMLLDAGLDPNTRLTGRGWTLLHVAAECGAKASLELLLSSSARVDERDNSGWTPLHHAVDSEADRAHQAERSPEPAATLILLRAGADPEAKNSDGETPMDFARDYEYRAALAAMREKRSS